MRKTSGVSAASSGEDIFHVCPTCGTHLSFGHSPALQGSDAPAEVTAYGADEPADVSLEHGCDETGNTKLLMGKCIK